MGDMTRITTGSPTTHGMHFPPAHKPSITIQKHRTAHGLWARRWEVFSLDTVHVGKGDLWSDFDVNGKISTPHSEQKTGDYPFNFNGLSKRSLRSFNRNACAKI
jgi:hypothetical protein